MPERDSKQAGDEALHTIVLTLRRIDPQTKAYVARRVGEGKSERDAVR